MIVLPARLRQRPNTARRLVRDFTKNPLVLVNPAAGMINQVTRSLGTNLDATNTKIQAGRFGRALCVVTAGGAYGWSFPLGDGVSSRVGPFTLLLHFVNVAAVTAGGFFSIAGSASSGVPTVLMNATTGNNLRFYINGDYRIIANGVLTAGSTHYLGITSDGTTVTMVRNGVVIGTYVPGGAIAFNAASDLLFLGNGFASSNLSETNLCMLQAGATQVSRLQEITRLPLGALFVQKRRQIAGWATGGDAAGRQSDLLHFF